MTFLTFKEEILSSLRNYFGNDYTLDVVPINKNNQISYQGLVIHQKNQNISPTIYLDPLYEAFQKGLCMNNILEQIKTAYHSTRPQENMDISFFADFQKVQSHICMKLIHYKKNEAFLENIPHIRFLDLAIAFYYLMPITIAEHATIMISNEHISHWCTTEQTLFELAKKNTPTLLPYYLDDIFSLIDTSELPESFNIQTSLPLYVLTNSEKLFGASAILYPQLLDSISLRMNSDLIILPSSIHEVLLLPAVTDTKKDYTAIINEVNTTQLSKEEILSDHAYYYSRTTKSIT